MQRIMLGSAVAACAVGAVVAIIAPKPHPKVGLAMSDAASAFLVSLDATQKAQASFSFTDDERINWHFVPRTRKGLPLKSMTPTQREKATALLRTAMSKNGEAKLSTIRSLELVLREMENNNLSRDPEMYFFSIFGTPAAKGAWGWRVEGHHFALNITVVNGQWIATTPQFFGANPADVRTGPNKGVRALGELEDDGRALITSLTEKQLSTAIYQKEAPTDIVTAAIHKADPLDPIGLPLSELNKDQQKLFWKLIDDYADTVAGDLAKDRRERAHSSDPKLLRFAWAGGIKKGEKHYYRIQAPTFLIEYDNTQNDANHIHSVWRDFNGDFGRDLLAEHYAGER